MTMKNPCHPGEIVREDCLTALDMTIAEVAAHLQIEEAALTEVCACEAPITPDLAIRFEMAFGSIADHWLAMQSAYDLAQARQSACRITRLEPAA